MESIVIWKDSQIHKAQENWKKEEEPFRPYAAKEPSEDHSPYPWAGW
jgi:hypothetical protein